MFNSNRWIHRITLKVIKDWLRKFFTGFMFDIAHADNTGDL